MNNYPAKYQILFAWPVRNLSLEWINGMKENFFKEKLLNIHIELMHDDFTGIAVIGKWVHVFRPVN